MSATGWIQTHSGGRFYPFQPRVTDVHLTDIAVGLSRACRFAGQCSRFYSVAEHSVLVSHLVPDELALEGLMHDASEAYLLDVPRPLKVLPAFDEYRTAEALTEAAIRIRFGLKRHCRAIKTADNLALALEARDLMPQREPQEWEWLPAIPKTLARYRIAALNPEAARGLFLDRAAALGLKP